MNMKKMMITAGIMAGSFFGIYTYFKNNPAKFNMMMKKMKNAVNSFEDEMMM